MSLPGGLDRADGNEDRPGTPDPAGSVLAQSVGGNSFDLVQIEEEFDSPQIELAEQATITHRFKMPWNEVLTQLQMNYRGVIKVDSFGNETMVLSARGQHTKGDQGTLEIVEEGKSFSLPPDEFRITPMELGINIIKHPRYFKAFFPDNGDPNVLLQNQSTIRCLQDYMERSSQTERDGRAHKLKNSLGKLEANAAGNIYGGSDIAKRAALEIMHKYWLGIETPYVAGWQITWSQFYRYTQPLNPGGYIEDPIYEATPQLPFYFCSPNSPYIPDGSALTGTIFDDMAKLNPQCFSDTGDITGSVEISWLRKADESEFSRTWFKINRTWIGSPVGYWDADLFSKGPRPSSPDDYIEVNAVLNPRIPLR